MTLTPNDYLTVRPSPTFSKLPDDYPTVPLVRPDSTSIEPLAYELHQAREVIGIHLVILVAQLELALKGINPYCRPRNHEPGPVTLEDADDDDNYEIERIIDRRVWLEKGKPVLQYLVKWLGYSAIHNRWYNAGDLDNAKDLMQDFDDAHPQEIRTLKPRRMRQRPAMVAPVPGPSTELQVREPDNNADDPQVERTDQPAPNRRGRPRKPVQGNRAQLQPT